MHILETPQPCAACGRETTRSYDGKPICVLCRSSQVRAALSLYKLPQPHSDRTQHDHFIRERLEHAERLALHTGSAIAARVVGYWRQQLWRR